MLVGVRGREALALGLGIGRRLQIAPVDDPDRGTGAHDPELGLGPRQHQVSAEVARVHRDVRAAVGLAQDDRHLRHASRGECAHERRAVADHAGLLLF